MIFSMSQGPIPALNFAFPDVCLTPIPTPVGPVPVPIPYPNISLSPTAIPTQFTVFHMAMPAHNLMTMIPLSNGDNAGLMLNPLSGLVMGPTRHLMGSFKVLYGGMPNTKMLDPTGQNGFMPGSFGMSLSPSQFKVMVLA